MERIKTTQAMRTTIQNKATTRTQKIRKILTVTTVIMMEMTHQKPPISDDDVNVGK